jgi:serine/threonine-protein kinase HipA
MSKNNLITVFCFGQEVGRLGLDLDQGVSYFQYNDEFLRQNLYPRLFPLLIRRMKRTQVFKKYNNDTFRALAPPFADSLPDFFGNKIFRIWMEQTHQGLQEISVLAQLAYVGTRGMGALEYQPANFLLPGDTININEIAEVMRNVIHQKGRLSARKLDHISLLNIFKMGSSAGGVRPKILVAEHSQSGKIIPGDIVVDQDYNHYIIKLDMEDIKGYSREWVEYTYYLAATRAGIVMMPTKMIEEKHFATLRFDRQHGQKKHVLTATGITGWDYRDQQVSSYENLFDLAIYLKCPHRDIEQLYRRMVFNLVFSNDDDHLKNHSFIYEEHTDCWELAPAYDITYSLNPALNVKIRSRALSINGKRTFIDLKDLSILADKYAVKNFKKIIMEIQDLAKHEWQTMARENHVPEKASKAIYHNFRFFNL